MPRRFRLPEGMLRRLFFALGILLPFVVYVVLRTMPLTRSFVLSFEARMARMATRTSEALHYVFLDEHFEANELVLCKEERLALQQELARENERNVGPARILPVEVLARAYGGDVGRVLVWKQEGAPFVVGEGVGIGNILLGMVREAKNDLAVVQVLTHKESVIPAMISGAEETVGILSGTGGAWMELRYVPKGSKVEVGDRVVTSGLGGVVERNIELGTVREILDEDPSPFYRIKVEPVISSDAWWEAEIFHFPSL